MAAGAVMGLRSDMVGRELAQALEGRVGAHNIFATRLGISGDKAKSFHTAAPEKRVEMLSQALGRYQGAVDAFGNTFEASWTAAIDNGKKFLGDTTMPLFNALKGELRDINTWFDANQSTVFEWSFKIGNYLVDAFNGGKRLILEYGPAFLEFADNAYERFRSIWVDVKPYIESAGDAIKDGLKDPGTIDRIIDALKLYAAIKVGGGLSSALGGIAGAGAGVGALGDIGGSVASVTGLGSAAAGAGVSLMVLAGALVDVALIYEAYAEYRSATKEVAASERAMNQTIVRNIAAWDTSSGMVDTSSKAFTGALDDARNNVSTFASALGMLGGLIASLYGLHPPSAADKAADDLSEAAEDHNQQMRDLKDISMLGVQPFNTWSADAAAAASKKKAGGAPAGGGHTNITVHMTISSNQAPGQIARRVVSELARLKRDPKASRNAPNFSGAR